MLASARASAAPDAQSPAARRAVALALAAVAVEWARALAGRQAAPAWVTLLLGGAALCALAIGFGPSELGLGRDRLPLRLLGGLAMGAVLLLPAAVRPGAPVIPLDLAAMAALISVGEEVAFRGALYAALERWAGAPLAVLGSAAAFTAAHVLSHPVRFLPAVAAMGLLLGCWRWACRDLVGPIAAHCLADLAL